MIMLTNRKMILASVLILIAVAVGSAQAKNTSPGRKQSTQADSFVGDWAMRMSDGSSGWLSITRVDGEWAGELWRVGQTKAITDFKLTNEKLTFTRQCRIGKSEFEGGPPTGQRVPCQFVATVQGDLIRVVMETAAGATPQTVVAHKGKRLPPLPPKPVLSKVKFGKPVRLFNGTDLKGWSLTNPKQLNGWKALNGELVNESPKETFEPYSRYGNLRTVRKFGDGKLTIEFNVPKGGNSGIYVRGAYEAQVVDRDSRMQGIHGVGSIFDRIKPSKNAGKAGGEWQSYEITIVDRHATVVLNGETVIDNQPVRGNTNGAFQADITIPGPLYLQGDHTAVRYRNIVFYPVVTQK
jgi:hypothetical protein